MTDPNPLAHAYGWFEIHTGIARGGPDPYYNFWSGFGSDLAEVAILGGVIQLFRHQNCHVKGCWRFGKPVDGTAYKACHVHHPAHAGQARNVSIETIQQAHAEANQ